MVDIQYRRASQLVTVNISHTIYVRRTFHCSS